MLSFLKILIAFALYAAIHTLLLTRSARLFLEAVFGQRIFRRWFRLGYSVQATVLFLVFLGYAASQPDVELLGIYGDGVWVLHLLRLAGLVLIVWSLRSIGFSSFLGIENWKLGRDGAMPAGDGLDGPEFEVRGPYRWVRHPMYTGGLLLIWPLHYWSVNRLAFVLAATAYLWLAVEHEERRMVDAYGDRYRSYRARTPRFFPHLGSKAPPQD